MQPPADLIGAEGPDLRRKMRDDMVKLNTPERIDRMGEIRVRHDAEALRGGPGGGRPWHLN